VTGRTRDSVCGKAKVPNGDVKLGIRPEHLVPVDKGGIAVTLQIAEPLEANTLLHGQPLATGQTITISLPGVHQTGPKTGSANEPEKKPENELGRNSRHFSVEPGHIHLFDPAIGKRLANT
jgi:sn-glycerol 3-phosphate transport system ATP-binding protein